MRIALDTTAYSALMRGHRDVVAVVRGSNRVLVPAVVAGELLFGFRRGSRFEENAARLDAFLRVTAVSLIPVNPTTADRFARIAAGLRSKGRPIPSNDIWIAAQAMESGADLLSSDPHFGEIEGLAWVPFSATEEESVRERTRRHYATPPGSDDGEGESR